MLNEDSIVRVCNLLQRDHRYTVSDKNHEMAIHFLNEDTVQKISKHDYFVCLCLNGTRVHRWRRMYRTLKHHHMHSDETNDKTWLFLNKVYSMSMRVKTIPAAWVVIMWWGIPWHSLQSLPSSLRLPQMVVPGVENHRVYVRF